MSNNNIIAFPANHRRDQEVVEYFKRRLAHERRARSGVMEDVEIVEQIMILNAEMFSLAQKFKL